MLKKRLRELREAHGRTRDDVAAHFDLNPQTIKFWELGYRAPSEARLRKICEYYGISMAEFYAGESDD